MRTCLWEIVEVPVGDKRQMFGVTMSPDGKLDGGSQPRWAHSGRDLFYRSAKERLVSVPVTPGPTFITGAPVELFDVSGYQSQIYSQTYDVSPDGKRRQTVGHRLA